MSSINADSDILACLEGCQMQTYVSKKVSGVLFGCAKSWLFHAESSSLTRNRTQAPLNWECRVLATGLPGKSQESSELVENRVAMTEEGMRHLYLRLEAGHANFDVMVKSIYPFSTRKQWKLCFFAYF